MTQTKNILDLKFDPPTQLFAMIARRFYGKSVLAANLIINLVTNNKVHDIYVISNTAQFNGSYDKFVKKPQIYPADRMDEIIDKIMEYQAKKKDKQRKNVLIVIDDVPLTTVSKSLANVASLGRHYNICCILCVQYSKAFLSPIIRGNIDQYFVGELAKKQLEALYEAWVSKFESFKDFYNYYKANIKKPLFIHFNCRENDVEKRLQLVTCNLVEKNLVVK